MVMNCMTPKDLWDTLCQSFEVSNKVYTLMQLYGLHMGKGTHMNLKLAAIEEEVNDNHKLNVLLCTVQDTYPSLVTALLAKGDDDLTSVFAKQALG